MIIGITGTLGAGKGTIVQYLKQKKDFEHFSVRSYLEEIIGQNANREALVKKANELRKENGSDYIIKQLYEQANLTKKNSIIESIRNVGEINTLRENKNFYLFSVDADINIRYNRIKSRGSSTDNVEFEKFKADEEKEFTSNDPNKQNLSACIKLADYSFLNNQNLENLFYEVENILTKIKKPEDSEFRISKDEYFIKIAATVAERSTCLRHNVGAVIVKEGIVVSTGYNGAVKGVESCLELGCLRDALNIQSGTRHEICRAAHAEQNAIAQAAYNGNNIKNSTMYCTHTPCMICTKLMINSGIKEIVSYIDYPDMESKKLLKEAGVKLRNILKPNNKINFKD